jgi:hypothetical protein
VFFDLLLTVVLPVFLVVLAGIAVGRGDRVSHGEFDADSLGFAGGVLSALFTVVLAFYIVFAWQTGADIASSSDTEANAVLDAYWQAESLPGAVRGQTQDPLRAYAQRVVDNEWTALATGGVDTHLRDTLRALRAAIAGVTPADDATQSARDNALADVRQIDESHRARVATATGGDAFNGVLLGGTLFGAGLMIVFPLFVGLSARPANIAVLALLTATIGATVFLSLQLAHPLEGVFAVGPDAFRAALAQMQAPTSG